MRISEMKLNNKLISEAKLNNKIVYSSKKIDIPNYIKDGLVLLLDGITNTKHGHDYNTTTWENLVDSDYNVNLVGLDDKTIFKQSYNFTRTNDDGTEGSYGVVNNIQNIKQIEMVFMTTDLSEFSGKPFNLIFSIPCGTNNLSLFTTTDNTTSTEQRLTFYAYKGPDYNIEDIQHVSITIDNSYCTFYLNGSLMQKFSFKYEPQKININYNVNNSLVNYTKIYSVRLYDRPLTDTEILHNYNIAKERYIANDFREEYITDNLIGLFDAINNTGSGHSEEVLNKWVNLADPGNDFIIYTANELPNGQFKKNYLQYTYDNQTVGGPGNDTTFDFSGGDGVTIEMCVDIDWGLHLRGFNIMGGDTNAGAFFNWFDTSSEYTTGGINIVWIGNKEYYNIRKSPEEYDAKTLTYVFDKTNKIIKLYYDGNLIQTESDSNLTIPDIQALRLGGRGWITYNSIIKVHNIRIYKKALTDKEIKRNYYMDYLTYGDKLKIKKITDEITGFDEQKTITLQFSGASSDIEFQKLNVSAISQNNNVIVESCIINYVNKTLELNLHFSNNDDTTDVINIVLSDTQGNTATSDVQCSVKEVKFSYTVSSEDVYPFTFDESTGYYISTNKGIHNSYSICKVTINSKGGHLYVDCISYGESNYDFGILSTLDNTLTYSSNADSTNVFKSFKGLASPSVQTVDYGAISPGEHFIYIKYRKDSSASSYDDTMKFSIRFEE